MRSTTTLKRYDGDQIVLLNQDFDIIGLNDPRKSKAKWAQLEIRSVQHTGTCFLHELLKKNGWYVRARHFGVAEGFTICPIREPKMAYITWKSRGRKEDFLTQWEKFNRAFIENDDLHVIPVDTDDREGYLSKLGERLKCHLSTDWRPVESRPRLEVDIDYDLLQKVHELSVVRKFYAPL